MIRKYSDLTRISKQNGIPGWLNPGPQLFFLHIFLPIEVHVVSSVCFVNRQVALLVNACILPSQHLPFFLFWKSSDFVKHLSFYISRKFDPPQHKGKYLLVKPNMVLLFFLLEIGLLMGMRNKESAWDIQDLTAITKRKLTQSSLTTFRPSVHETKYFPNLSQLGNIFAAKIVLIPQQNPLIPIFVSAYHLKEWTFLTREKSLLQESINLPL